MKLLFKNVWSYYSQFKLYTSIYYLGVIVDLTVESFVALSFKFLLDNAILPKNEKVMVIVLLLLVLGTVLTKAGYAFRCYLYSKTVAGIMRNVRNRLFGQLQELSMKFFSNARTGDILSHFSSDISSIEYTVNMAVPAGVSAFLGIVINMTVIVALEWKLAVIALAGLVLCALGPYVFSARTSKANDLLKEKQAELLSRVDENIGAQKVIKSFSLAETVRKDFGRNADELSRFTSKAFFLNALMEMTPNIAIELIKVLIICVGAILAFKDYITPGTLVSFNSLFIGLSTAVGCFTWVMPALMESSASMRRIQGFLNENPEIRNTPGARDIREFRDCIEFSDVTFGYCVEQSCLDHLSFRLPEGKSVAFLGPSGSGKSSVLNLLMRFYDPDYGNIKIDGRDIREVTLESLHRLTGIVLQENVLFNASIRENLQLVYPEAGEEDIVDAAKAAEIHDFIMSLPKGYDTVAGERGGQLSGGQRQRIALARALIRRPSILILDEATSSLDARTEKSINKALERIAGGTTIINITHRLQNIRNYDLIYVMEKGRIAEMGNHGSLLEKGGIYAELYGKQGGFTVSEDHMHAEIEAGRLSRIHLFENLDPEMLEEVAGHFISEFYEPGQAIIYQGDRGDRFFVIARGRVEVFVTSSDGSEKTINILEDGDHFGEIALLKDVARTASVRASVPSLILSLGRRYFERIIGKAPGLAAELEKKMNVRLSDLESKQMTPASSLDINKKQA